jgi:hypothetical protein
MPARLSSIPPKVIDIVTALIEGSNKKDKIPLEKDKKTASRKLNKYIQNKTTILDMPGFSR